MSIQADVKELQNIDNEIRRLQKQVKILRNRRTIVETNIKSYLDEKDQPGVKYQDIAIIIDNRKGRVRVNDKEKKERLLDILTTNGINNAEELITELIESMKGAPINKSYIKLQKIK